MATIITIAGFRKTGIVGHYFVDTLLAERIRWATITALRSGDKIEFMLFLFFDASY